MSDIISGGESGEGGLIKYYGRIPTQLSRAEVEIGSVDEAAYYEGNFEMEVIMLVRRPPP